MDRTECCIPSSDILRERDERIAIVLCHFLEMGTSGTCAEYPFLSLFLPVFPDKLVTENPERESRLKSLEVLRDAVNHEIMALKILDKLPVLI